MIHGVYELPRNEGTRDKFGSIHEYWRGTWKGVPMTPNLPMLRSPRDHLPNHKGFRDPARRAFQGSAPR